MNWERWSPLAGALAAVAMFVAFSINTNSPGTGDSDTKITSYLVSHSDQVRNILGFFLFLAGVLLLLVFFWVLRSRLVAAEGGLSRLAALAYGSGVASAVLSLTAVCVFAGPAITANDTGRFRPDPNLYRLANDTGYLFWTGAVTVGALVVWATSAAALRTGLLPRWFGWLGILVGIVQLFAIFFIPGIVYWAWILLAAVLLAWKSPSPTPAPTPSTTQAG